MTRPAFSVFLQSVEKSLTKGFIYGKTINLHKTPVETRKCKAEKDLSLSREISSWDSKTADSLNAEIEVFSSVPSKQVGQEWPTIELKVLPVATNSLYLNHCLYLNKILFFTMIIKDTILTIQF